nr:hypothetical protein [Thalassobacillus sp. CUG 92003]
MVGTLVFDSQFKQSIRQSNQGETGFRDPILQVQKQKINLAKWLSNHLFPHNPIVTYVVISNPSSVIKSTVPDHRTKHIIREDNLPFVIDQLNSLYVKACYTPDHIQRLGEACLHNHTEYNPDIPQRFQLCETDLLKGVRCPGCDPDETPLRCVVLLLLLIFIERRSRSDLRRLSTVA